MDLDTGTLLFVSLLFSALFAAIMAVMRTMLRTPVPALREWSIAYALFAVAAGGFLLRNVAPVFVSYVAAHTAYVAGFACVYAGIRRFKGRAVPAAVIALFTGVLFVLFVVFTYVEDTFRGRVVAEMVAEALVCIAALRELRGRDLDRGNRAAHLFTAAGLVVGGGVALVRAVVTLRSDVAPALFAYSGIHVMYVASHLFVAVAIGLGFIMMTHLKLREQLQFLASHDSLTNAYTHRVFLDLTQRELARARREPAPVALLMLDLDLFKRVNDTHGHVAGDHVLAGVAALLRRGLRGHDLLGRYGGEEFAVALPGVTVAEAAAIAERTRSAIAAAAYDTPAGPLHITASIGVAVAPDGHGRVEDLVALADAGLYEAKRSGRNRVGCPAVLAPDASDAGRTPAPVPPRTAADPGSATG